MTNNTAASRNEGDVEELVAAIDRLTNDKPYAANLLRAFGPLLVAKHSWLAKTQGATRMFSVDPLNSSQGIPVIQQCRLLLPEDPWQDAGFVVAAAIGQGFPQYAGDMQYLARCIRGSEVDCYALCDVAEPGDRHSGQPPTRALDPVSLQFFQRSLVRLMLAQRARDLKGTLASWSWTKGYCPICGSFPHLAVIREQGQRWLQCSTCSHEWAFARLTCPYCEHEEPQGTHTYFVEGENENSVFTCGKCMTYLLTSNQSGALHRYHSDILAFSLAHLDFILQEKGFLPMAECEWNTFTVPRKTDDKEGTHNNSCLQ